MGSTRWIIFLTILISTGCGNIKPITTHNSGISSVMDSGQSGKTPNPYWKNQRRVGADTQELFARAIDALQSGDLDNAEQQFSLLSRSHPKLSGSWVNLGIIHYQRGEQEQAEANWIKAIKLNRLNFDAYTNLALLKREQGDFEKAESIYKTALAKWPDNAEMHCNLGILYDLYQGRQELALQEYLVCEQLSDEPSRRLRGWIVDLERRTQALAKN